MATPRERMHEAAKEIKSAAHGVTVLTNPEVRVFRGEAAQEVLREHLETIKREVANIEEIIK